MKNTITYYIERFFVHKELAENLSKVTLEGYRGYLLKFVEWYGDKSVSGITSEVIFQFRLWISKRKGRDGRPLSDKSRREYFVALRSFFKYLNKTDVLTIVAEKIDIPKAIPPLIIPLTKDEVENIFQATAGDDLISLRNRALLEVLYCTGSRISEILNVNRDEIDIDLGEFPVMGKGRKARPVFLSNRALDALRIYLKNRTDDFRPLFIDHSTNACSRGKGGRISRRSVSLMLRTIARGLGITKIVTPHKLRHSIATHMLQDGIDIRTIQKMLGHATIRSTEIYTNVTDFHLKKAVLGFHDGAAKELEMNILNKEIRKILKDSTSRKILQDAGILKYLEPR